MENVSVIIPNYNRCGLVNETVRNVLGQTLPPYEVIVVDDGSTDNSVASLAEEFGDRIQLITQKNQGPGAARNVGLDRATGDFIWLMDSDDIASLNKLEVQVRALQEHSADVVYSPWARVFFRDSTVRLECPVLQQSAVPASRDVLTWFMTDWSLVFQHCLFRTSIIRKAGLYRTDMWTCDDSEYFVRILQAGARTIFEDRSLTLYRCDDHGKVTGSGFRSTRRMVDCWPWWKPAAQILRQHVILSSNCDSGVQPGICGSLLRSMLIWPGSWMPSATDLILPVALRACSSGIRNPCAFAWEEHTGRPPTSRPT